MLNREYWRRSRKRREESSVWVDGVYTGGGGNMWHVCVRVAKGRSFVWQGNVDKERKKERKKLPLHRRIK
jgi:hypothetical protein